MAGYTLESTNARFSTEGAALKPADFDYEAPTELSEALSILASTEEAKVLAGGQSLVPLLNFRLATPSLLVDIGRVRGLGEVCEADGGIGIGAMARQADVLCSGLVADRVPLLPLALAWVGHPQIRSRGTVVGSLVHHDPAAELPAVAVALDARITLRSAAGARTVGAAEFFQSHYVTDVRSDEIATEAWFPASPPGSGAAYEEIARRHGDFALAGVAAQITVHGGEIIGAAVALSAVAERPLRARAVESALLGRPPTEETFATAARAVDGEQGLRPNSDIHASAAYRRDVLPILVSRAPTGRWSILKAAQSRLGIPLARRAQS